ncbi:MAG: isoprenyl transferase [Prevotellaceae bacterium]|jgi:undecaprenyl diphosphate synthase|nr:isoprenyl transferase [Prevotellaceae bacterium]
MAEHRQSIPQHVAIIMDGNGRWAKRQGLKRIFGHRHAVEAVRVAITTAGESGVKYLSLYTFSEENWNRPQEEIDGLMELLVDAIRKETPELNKNNVRLNSIGNIALLPPKVQHKLQDCIDNTASNTGLTVLLALSYSGRWDILQAVKHYIADVLQQGTVPELTAETFEQYLSTADIPEPDLLIRTGGEKRISNFLIWQMAYTEFYFSDILWPDFRKKDFLNAINEYNKRERRFGLTGDQVKKQ